MMVRVIYENGSYDMVKGAKLDKLIEQGEVAGFQRSDGWVVIGRDPVRQSSRQSSGGYLGPERRGQHSVAQIVRW